PPLPRLEALNLRGALVGDEELRELAVLPSLKILDITKTYVTAGGLRELACLDSLEHLNIDNEVVSASSLESLLSISRLKRVCIDPASFRVQIDDQDALTSVPLDNDGHVDVWPSEADDCRVALEALRRYNPGIVIDNGQTPFDQPRIWRGFNLDELPP